MEFSDFFNALLKSATVQQQPIALHQVIARLSQHARPGSLVYIISDFRGLDHQTENYLAKLARHCDVVMILVYDPLECKLPTRGRYRFTNDITDIVIDTSDQQRVLNYQDKFHQHSQQLEMLCKKLRLKFIQCSTAQDPAQSLR